MDIDPQSISRDIEQRFIRLLRIDPLVAQWHKGGTTPGDFKELVVLLGERSQEHMKTIRRLSLHQSIQTVIFPCPVCEQHRLGT